MIKHSIMSKTFPPRTEEGESVSAGTGRLTRTAVIERFGGCCCGGRVERNRVKSRINTVTEAVPAHRQAGVWPMI